MRRWIPAVVALLGGCAGTTDDPPHSTPVEPTTPSTPEDTATTDDGGPGCEVALPADAIVVEGIEETTAADSAWWVCDGGDLTSGDSGSQIFLEAGAKALITWPGATVWVPRDASAIVLTGGVTVVHHRMATVVNEAPGTVFIDCDDVIYDRSAAPEPGCAPVEDTGQGATP